MHPTLNLPDARLQFLFMIEPLKHATLSEYASASGMDVMEVLQALDETLETGALALETVGDEIFVHTHPDNKHHGVEVPANLWELLRLAGTPEYAYSLWRLVRGLEWGGWRVLIRPERARSASAGFLSLEIHGHPAPVIAFPDTAQLASGGAFVAASGESRVVVTTGNGNLEAASTAVRKHLLTSRNAALEVVILEAPRYQPVVIRADDTSVRGRNVSIANLQQP